MGFEPDLGRDARRMGRETGSLFGATVKLFGSAMIRAPFGLEVSDKQMSGYQEVVDRAGDAFVDLTASSAGAAADRMSSYRQQLSQDVPQKSYPRWMFWRH